MEFEGEYLNGLRNGKGFEYYNSKCILFEGEYLKGKRNGKCKEYYENGYILFEGEYLNGKKMENVKNIMKMVKYYLKGNI